MAMCVKKEVLLVPLDLFAQHDRQQAPYENDVLNNDDAYSYICN
tara:strand:+ start:341 stop:472 length:132 start_codon:yes stop_codon:yes gene_type:complete